MNEKRLLEDDPKAWMTRSEFKKILQKLYDSTDATRSVLWAALSESGLDDTAFEDWFDGWNEGR